MTKPAKNQYLSYRLINWLLRHTLRALPATLWVEKFALWWGYRFRPLPGVVTLRSGTKIQIDHADHLQLLIYYLGTFESYCLTFLRGCAGKGGTIVDVGANIGFYTLESAAAVGGAGRVIAIEAAPRHLESLKRNIELNNMKNVSIIGSAVGETPGHATLTLPRGDNLGMFTLGRVEGDETYVVSISTIDELLGDQGIESLDLIKMDIEGSEFSALRGAARTLQKFRPSILIEINNVALRRCGASAIALKNYLNELGYRGWRIRRDSIEVVSDADDEGCDEFLYVHSSNEHLIQRLGMPL